MTRPSTMTLRCACGVHNACPTCACPCHDPQPPLPLDELARAGAPGRKAAP